MNAYVLTQATRERLENMLTMFVLYRLWYITDETAMPVLDKIIAELEKGLYHTEARLANPHVYVPNPEWDAMLKRMEDFHKQRVYGAIVQ